MRFKLALLTALPLALCAAEKPSFSSTGYFTPECLASFPQAEFRQETEAAWKAALAEKPERLRLLSRLKAAGSPRSAAVAKRLEILDSLIAYIAARLEAGASILNVSAAARTPEVVRAIRKDFPDVPIIATGGGQEESIMRTVEAGANAISYTPPTTKELFSSMMEDYRNRE